MRVLLNVQVTVAPAATVKLLGVPELQLELVSVQPDKGGLLLTL